MPEIKVTISPLGLAKVDAQGFTGTSCADATKGIENALSGGEVSSSRVLKTEWYEQEQEQATEGIKW